MKTNLLTLTVTLLLLGVGFVACEDSEEIQAKGTPPVAAPEEISAFFEKYLPESSYSYPEPEFDFGELDNSERKCLLINSMEAFKTVAPPSVELPVIDFEKYTLIIGYHCMGNPGYFFEKQAVDTVPDEMILNLIYRSGKGFEPAVITTFYFWGLYAKLPDKPIRLDITII